MIGPQWRHSPMAEEPRLFFRSAVFGLVVAAIYWLVSGEVAGTILLGAFGLAGVLLTGVLLRAWRSQGGHLRLQPGRLVGLETIDDAQRVVPEVERFPSPGLAPLLGGLGLTLAGLSLAWGPAFIIVALPLLLLAALSWYRSAVREYPGSGQRQRTGQPRGAEPHGQPVAVDSTSAPGPSPAGTAHLAAPAQAAGRTRAVRSETDVTAAAAIVAVVLAIPLLGALLQRIPWIGARTTRGKG